MERIDRVEVEIEQRKKHTNYLDVIKNELKLLRFNRSVLDQRQIHSPESRAILLNMVKYIILINIWRNTQLGQIIIEDINDWHKSKFDEKKLVEDSKIKKVDEKPQSSELIDNKKELSVVDFKKITIDSDLRRQITEQGGSEKERLHELELCLINMFNNYKYEKELHEAELNRVRSTIENPFDMLNNFKYEKGLDEAKLNRIISTIENPLLRNTLDNIAAKNDYARPALPLDLFVDEYFNNNTITYLIRLHIIEQIQQLFEQHDISLINENSPNHSTQRASFNIQLKLKELLNLSAVELENKCASIVTLKLQTGQLPTLPRNVIAECPDFIDGEGIQELITTTIGNEIGVAGSIPDWYKKDKYFGETLKKVATYNHKEGNDKNISLDELFLRNPFQPITEDFNNNQRDDREIDQKRQSLIAVILIMTAWYSGKDNPLGKYYADTADYRDPKNPTKRTQYNTRFGHLIQMEEIKKIAENMIFDPRPSQVVIDDIINDLSRIIDEIEDDNFSFRESRAANELKLLARHFCKPEDKDNFIVDSNAARFDIKPIFNYKMNDQESTHIIRLYLMQELNQKLSQYHSESSQRSSVTTAVVKDKDFWQLESGVNYLYNAPLQKLWSDYANLQDCKPTDKSLNKLERLIRNKIGSILDFASGQGLAGKIRLKSVKYLHKVLNDDMPDYLRPKRPVILHNSRISTDNCNFNVLAARLLAILNAYCNTELAYEFRLEKNKGPMGHYQLAIELADLTAALFLQRNSNEQEKLRQLKEHILKVAKDIEGNWLIGSPNSRLRLSLMELGDASLIQTHLDGNKDSLLFNADKSMQMFPDADTEKAKKFIHNHVIAEVRDHLNNFQREKVDGVWSDKPGYFQERVIADIRNELNTFSRLSFEDQSRILRDLSREISQQLNQDYVANICDLVRKIISKHVAPCSNLARCYLLPPVINTFLDVCNTLNKYDPDSSITDIESMLRLPTRVSRCLPVREELDGTERHRRNMYIANVRVPLMSLLTNIHILCGFYLNHEMGNRYADLMGVSHNLHNGLREEAEELLQFATQIYINLSKTTHKPDEVISIKVENVQAVALKYENDKKSMIIILNKMKEIVAKVKASSFSQCDFGVELIKLINRYGYMNQLLIKSSYEIDDNEKGYKEDGKFLSITDFGIYGERVYREDLAHDYIESHIIQQTAQEYTKLKDRLNISGNLPFAEYESILQTEKNLDEIYRLSFTERRKRINQLKTREDSAPKTIIDLIKSVKADKIPYDYLSSNSYLRKCALNPAERNVRNYLNGLSQPASVEQAEMLRTNLAPIT